MKKLPKLNGRPQLWFSIDEARSFAWDRLRIVYPSGKVEYYNSCLGKFEKGCTSSKTQKEAVIEIQRYSEALGATSEFLGYL